MALDSNDNTSNAIFAFIEDAMKKGESTLVHSIKGQTRAATVVILYLMRKYRWGLLKALEFMTYRRPDLEIRSNFLNQLSAFEKRLPKIIGIELTTKWSGKLIRNL